MPSIGLLLTGWLALLGRVAGQTLQVPIQLGGLVDVQVGTPPQQFKLLLDTGSANTWLRDANARSLYTVGAASFNAQTSTTFKPDGREWFGQYGVGLVVKGKLARDEFRLAPGRPASQLFALVHHSEGLALNNFDFDGALGLADRAKPAVGVLDLVQNLHRERLVQREVFSMHLLRESTAINGTLVVGGVEPQFYTGALTYVPIESRWTFFVDRVYLAGAFGDRLVSTWQLAALDSTANVIEMPETAARAFWQLSRTELDPNTSLHKFDTCDDAEWETDLVLELSGRNFTVPGKHLVIKLWTRQGDLFSEQCFSAVMATKRRWLLGYPFLRNFYTVYDYANKQVGIAEPTSGEIAPQASG